jgi:hypothetical protein
MLCWRQLQCHLRRLRCRLWHRLLVAAGVAVPVHQQLQSDLIGFVLCLVELAALPASQQEMMWKM